MFDFRSTDKKLKYSAGIATETLPSRSCTCHDWWSNRWWTASDPHEQPKTAWTFVHRKPPKDCPLDLEQQWCRESCPLSCRTSSSSHHEKMNWSWKSYCETAARKCISRKIQLSLAAAPRLSTMYWERRSSSTFGSCSQGSGGVGASTRTSSWLSSLISVTLRCFPNIPSKSWINFFHSSRLSGSWTHLIDSRAQMSVNEINRWGVQTSVHERNRSESTHTCFLQILGAILLVPSQAHFIWQRDHDLFVLLNLTLSIVQAEIFGIQSASGIWGVLLIGPHIAHAMIASLPILIMTNTDLMWEESSRVKDLDTQYLRFEKLSEF